MLDQTKKTDLSQQEVENYTETKSETIMFHQTEINCIIDPDGTIRVALKPIMDAIGLHADSAWKSIKKDPILGANHAVRHALDAQNRQFPMQTLPIEHVHGWLFGIDSSKVKAEVQPKLLEFKRECYQVLFNHFYGKYKVYEDNLGAKRILWEKRHVIQEEIRSLQSKASSITKQIREIDQAALSGQFTLAVKGGENAN